MCSPTYQPEEDVSGSGQSHCIGEKQKVCEKKMSDRGRPSSVGRGRQKERQVTVTVFLPRTLEEETGEGEDKEDDADGGGAGENEI